MSKTTYSPVDIIRGIAMDAPQKANSGHPGAAMALAPIGWELFSSVMKHNPKNPDWLDRDRFVLSCGHACTLLYSLLHLSGYDLTMEDLKDFRQSGSQTPGHPENFVTKGIETTTGPLGQGFSTGVGMAIAEAHLAGVFNQEDLKLVDHHTYVIASDGDLMEGIAYEAASLAGHLELGKLIVFYDDNRITIEGRTDLTFSEEVQKRFESQNWQVLVVSDINDREQLRQAVKEAQAEGSKPSLVMVKSIIGYPSPKKQDTPGVHGSPLGDEEIEVTKGQLGLPVKESFFVPDEVYEESKELVAQGTQREQEWNQLWEEYQQKYPELAKKWESFHQSDYQDLDWEVPFPDKTKWATRESSGVVLNHLAKQVESLFGGSADLAPSTKTWINGCDAFSKDTRAGRNFHFGIREHAMAAIANGIANHGGLRPYVSTFFVFSDYMKPSVRLAALMKEPVVYVWTHDSIGLGEDGPTHQPIEHLAALRALPNFQVIRPCDQQEVVYAWKVALESKIPTGLVLTRQGVENLDYEAMGSKAQDLEKGAYILKDASSEPQALILASGSEVGLALEAQQELESKGVATRVVSMPCWELFEAQDADYREKVLPSSVRVRVAVEAGSSLGWHRWVGSEGALVTLDRFGASGPWEENYERLGLTSQNIVEKVLELKN